MRYVVIIFFIVNIPILGQSQLISPNIPDENRDLIYIEAEDALVTNFATNPTLNYSASGKRTLQLSTYNSNFKGNPYFIDFEIYVKEEGEYSFWYSGTPPGTREDLYPSYSSPLKVIIDNKEVKLYREDVNVVERYAPGLYWIFTNSSFSLDKGYHHVRLEVEDKRGFDGKFYMFIDSLFLFKGSNESPGDVPLLFPKDMNNRSIDNPFNTISYYQNKIKASPENIGNYLSLANIYIIIGDYFNSIKMLNRVIQIEPDHKDGNLLMAKARIWNGDIDVGLNLYSKYLNLYPKSLSVWGEAGKIAAWVSNYDKSIDFYMNGLDIYPDDISLRINLALTLLWKGDIDEGLEILRETEDGLDSVNSLLTTLDTYKVNGYPDYAVELNLKGIKKFPEALELYLYLDRLYYSEGSIDKSNKVIELISSIFKETDELKSILSINNSEKKAKEEFIKNLVFRVEANPRDLDLRELLVQTYFWNGLTVESINEYKKIITIKHLDEVEKLLMETSDLIELKNQLIKMELLIITLKERRDIIVRDFYSSLIDYRSQKSKKSDLTQEILKVETTLKSLDRVMELELMLKSEFTSIKESLDIILKDNNERKVTFESLLSGNSWFFDDVFLIDELYELSLTDFSEAAYVGSVVSLLMDDIGTTSKFLNLISDDSDLRSSEVFNLYNLWNYSTDKELLLEKFNNINPRPRDINTSLINRDKEITTQLDSSYKELTLLLGSIRELNKSVNKTLFDYVTRSIYFHQEYTYQIRYTIGSYYLETSQYKEALEQFNHVVNIDPQNVSGIFKLGRVSQLTGDWSRAMESYKRVFNVDPTFESAASMYNTLSKNHPETTDIFLSYLLDSNQMKYIEKFRTNFIVNSYLTIFPDYESNTLNYYKWSDYGSPLDFRGDIIKLGGNISLFNSSFTITPQLGASIYNNKFSYISPISDGDFEDTIEAIELYPTISLDSSLKIKEYNIGVGLSHNQEISTLPEERMDIYTTGGDIWVSGYYPLSFNKLNSFSFRSYYRLDGKVDELRTNLVNTAIQDLILGFILIKTPWTILNIYSSTSYEFSSITPINEYYTPDRVFVSKLGGVIASWFPLLNGVTGVSFRYGGGIYIDKTGLNSDISFTTDGELEINYTLRDRTIFFKIFGSGAFSDFENPDYWSIQSTIGIKIDSYQLLAL